MNRVLEPEVMDIPERARAYADADFAEVNVAFVQRVLELAGDRPMCAALDLGCGPGEVALRLAAERPEWTVLGVDASRPMLTIAQEAQRSADCPNVSFQKANATRLPYSPKRFDVVFSNSLLHHLPDPAPFWEEVKRVAGSDATVLIRDLIRPDSKAEARRLVDAYARDEHELLRDDFYHSFLAAFTLDEIGGQIAAAGLTDQAHVRCITDRHVDIELRF